MKGRTAINLYPVSLSTVFIVLLTITFLSLFPLKSAFFQSYCWLLGGLAIGTYIITHCVAFLWPRLSRWARIPALTLITMIILSVVVYSFAKVFYFKHPEARSVMPLTEFLGTFIYTLLFAGVSTATLLMICHWKRVEFTNEPARLHKGLWAFVAGSAALVIWLCQRIAPRS